MRKNITPKLRFQVLERDGFCCKYCGRFAPNVQLEIDHIIPISRGGTNELNNLVTSCFECNRGKGKYEKQESSKNLYKIKINDKINNLKGYLYNKWNLANLGTIENNTKTLLSIIITNRVKGLDGYNYRYYFDFPPLINKYKFLNINEIENTFKLGLDFCDNLLDYLYEDEKSNIDYIFEELFSDKWKKDVSFNEKLNYTLTEQWDGEFYIIKKYVLFPYAYKYEQN